MNRLFKLPAALLLLGVLSTHALLLAAPAMALTVDFGSFDVTAGAAALPSGPSADTDTVTAALPLNATSNRA